MDFKSPIASTSHTVDTFIETIPNIVTPATKNPLPIFCTNNKTDALEAVKLDPAVLEAQVTVDTRQTLAESSNSRDDVADEAEESAASNSFDGFEEVVSQHEAALLSLTPDKLTLLMSYVDLLRKQRMAARKYTECVFCKNNGKSLYWYTSHALRDARGRVQCPVLRSFRCPRCGATGDRAHTVKYCREPAPTDARSSVS